MASPSALLKRVRPSHGLLALPPLAAAGLVGLTLRRPALNEPLFVQSTYYVLLVLVLVYVGLHLARPGGFSPRAWFRENRIGLLVTVAVSAIVLGSVAPSFRVLADESNLVGVSKNLFFRHTANFAVSGKWYFENYWDVSLASDRRPALYPFLVSLLHLVRGYHAENAFHLNAILFVLFVFTCYRLGKRLNGEVFGVAAAILSATNPNTLVAARSAGFDFLSTFVLLLVVYSFVEYTRDKAPWRLAVLALNLCLLSHVRYEGWAVLLATGMGLLVLRLVPLSNLRPYAWLYSVLPLFLVPRYWQSIAKAKDAEQPLSASLFGMTHLSNNLREYLAVVLKPLELDGPHAPVLIPLAALGVLLVLFGLGRRLRARSLPASTLQITLLVAGLFALESAICFSYFWGKSMHPASCRLYIWLDTFVAFAAAWPLTLLGRKLAVPVHWLQRRSEAPVTVLACALLFAIHVPVAIEARFVNVMLVTREAAENWRFFERLGDKRILILTDRPGLYTIMDYGASDISTADSNRNLLFELSRALYHDIYMIQEVSLDTHQPLPGFDTWRDVEKQSVHEFQNTDSTLIRISRIKKPVTLN
ncbi:MAG TPA: glycosyltransferase family 39 protein [Polyangiaceae bacterium]|nr:glycosyltransferase family 39 protein [Polyangiaceae bacterium]